jgi:multiple sugar transport system substrate-binding protein
MPLMIPWTPFPGPNAIRITETIANNLARIAESRATPEEVQRDMVNEVRRLLRARV